MIRSEFALSLPLLATLAALTPAQSGYRWEFAPELGIKFKIPEKLQSIPLKLGGDRGNLYAKFEPDQSGWIHGKWGRYSWEVEIYGFDGKPPDDPTTGKPGDPPKTREEAIAAAKEAAARSEIAVNFDQWVHEKDKRKKGNRSFLIEGQATRGRGKSLEYRHWEYQDYATINTGVRTEELVWHQFAAVAKFDGREVAIVINMPGDERGKIAKRGGIKSKHVSVANTILRSITPMTEKELEDTGGADAKKDRWAKTETQIKALEAAKKNIAGVEGWDYFTSPNYIVLYSFPPDNRGKQNEARKFAEKLVEGVEDIRTEYERFYPPHDKMAKPYSVLRIASDYSEFRQYGEVPVGVVGFFSPRSKELVMFDDSQNQFGGEDYVVQVAYHEAWHQYANAYFGNMELHRWFDEGTGDFFGGFTKSGRNWKYEYDRGRYQSIRRQLNDESFIPVAEIVTWNKDKFYGPRGADHYAQGYSIVDFLYRGERKTGRRWNASWDEIIPTYVKTCLETKSQKKAAEAAFAGVDFPALEDAWLSWVKKYMKSDKTQPKPMKSLQ